MRKDVKDMTDAEKRVELAHQRDFFRHLVSSFEYPLAPKTWLGRWWRKWGEGVVTTVKIVVYTAIVCGLVAGGMWVAITLATAI